MSDAVFEIDVTGGSSSDDMDKLAASILAVVESMEKAKKSLGSSGTFNVAVADMSGYADKVEAIEKRMETLTAALPTHLKGVEAQLSAVVSGGLSEGITKIIEQIDRLSASIPDKMKLFGNAFSQTVKTMEADAKKAAEVMDRAQSKVTKESAKSSPGSLNEVNAISSAVQELSGHIKAARSEGFVKADELTTYNAAMKEIVLDFVKVSANAKEFDDATKKAYSELQQDLKETRTEYTVLAAEIRAVTAEQKELDKVSKAARKEQEAQAKNRTSGLRSSFDKEAGVEVFDKDAALKAVAQVKASIKQLSAEMSAASAKGFLAPEEVVQYELKLKELKANIQDLSGANSDMGGAMSRAMITLRSDVIGVSNSLRDLKASSVSGVAEYLQSASKDASVLRGAVRNVVLEVQELGTVAGNLDRVAAKRAEIEQLKRDASDAGMAVENRVLQKQLDILSGIEKQYAANAIKERREKLLLVDIESVYKGIHDVAFSGGKGQMFHDVAALTQYASKLKDTKSELSELLVEAKKIKDVDLVSSLSAQIAEVSKIQAALKAAYRGVSVDGSTQVTNNEATKLQEQVALINKLQELTQRITETKKKYAKVKWTSGDVNDATNDIKQLRDELEDAKDEASRVSSQLRAAGIEGSESFKDVHRAISGAGREIQSFTGHVNSASNASNNMWGKFTVASGKFLLGYHTLSTFLGMVESSARATINLFDDIMTRGEGVISTQRALFIMREQDIESTRRDFAQLTEIADYYGKARADLSESFKSWKAMITQSGYDEKGMMQLYQTIVGSTTALGINRQDEIKDYMKAFTQIFSKGTFAAEEVNQQLAERIYGLLAGMKKELAAMKGVDESKIDLQKLMSTKALSLNEGFIALSRTLSKYQEIGTSMQDMYKAELARLSTAWEDFTVQLAVGPVGQTITELVRDLQDLLKDDDTQVAMYNVVNSLAQVSKIIMNLAKVAVPQLGDAIRKLPFANMDEHIANTDPNVLAAVQEIGAGHALTRSEHIREQNTPASASGMALNTSATIATMGLGPAIKRILDDIGETTGAYDKKNIDRVAADIIMNDLTGAIKAGILSVNEKNVGSITKNKEDIGLNQYRANLKSDAEIAKMAAGAVNTLIWENFGDYDAVKDFFKEVNNARVLLAGEAGKLAMEFAAQTEARKPGNFMERGEFAGIGTKGDLNTGAKGLTEKQIAKEKAWWDKFILENEYKKEAAEQESGYAAKLVVLEGKKEKALADLKKHADLAFQVYGTDPEKNTIVLDTMSLVVNRFTAEQSDLIEKIKVSWQTTVNEVATAYNKSVDTGSEQASVDTLLRKAQDQKQKIKDKFSGIPNIIPVAAIQAAYDQIDDTINNEAKALVKRKDRPLALLEKAEKYEAAGVKDAWLKIYTEIGEAEKGFTDEQVARQYAYMRDVESATGSRAAYEIKAATAAYEADKKRFGDSAELNAAYNAEIISQLQQQYSARKKLYGDLYDIFALVTADPISETAIAAEELQKQLDVLIKKYGDTTKAHIAYQQELQSKVIDKAVNAKIQNAESFTEYFNLRAANDAGVFDTDATAALKKYEDIYDALKSGGEEVGNVLEQALTDSFNGALDSWDDVVDQMKSKMVSTLASIVWDTQFKPMLTTIVAGATGFIGSLGKTNNVANAKDIDKATTGSKGLMNVLTEDVPKALDTFGKDVLKLSDNMKLSELSMSGLTGMGIGYAMGGDVQSSLGGGVGGVLGKVAGESMVEGLAGTIGPAMSAIMPGVGTILGSVAGTVMAQAFTTETKIMDQGIILKLDASGLTDAELYSVVKKSSLFSSSTTETKSAVDYDTLQELNDTISESFTTTTDGLRKLLGISASYTGLSVSDRLSFNGKDPEAVIANWLDKTSSAISSTAMTNSGITADIGIYRQEGESTTDTISRLAESLESLRDSAYSANVSIQSLTGTFDEYSSLTAAGVWSEFITLLGEGGASLANEFVSAIGYNIGSSSTLWGNTNTSVILNGLTDAVGRINDITQQVSDSGGGSTQLGALMSRSGDVLSSATSELNTLLSYVKTGGDDIAAAIIQGVMTGNVYGTSNLVGSYGTNAHLYTPIGSGIGYTTGNLGMNNLIATGNTTDADSAQQAASALVSSLSGLIELRENIAAVTDTGITDYSAEFAKAMNKVMDSAEYARFNGTEGYNTRTGLEELLRQTITSSAYTSASGLDARRDVLYGAGASYLASNTSGFMTVDGQQLAALDTEGWTNWLNAVVDLVNLQGDLMAPVTGLTTDTEVNGATVSAAMAETFWTDMRTAMERGDFLDADVMAAWQEAATYATAIADTRQATKDAVEAQKELDRTYIAYASTVSTASRLFDVSGDFGAGMDGVMDRMRGLVQADLPQWFELTGDEVMESLVPGLQAFREDGETLFETLTRLTAVMSSVNKAAGLARTSLEIVSGTTGLDAANYAQQLADYFGGSDVVAYAFSTVASAAYTDDELSTIAENYWREEIRRQTEALGITPEDAQEYLRQSLSGVMTPETLDTVNTLATAMNALDAVLSSAGDSADSFADQLEELRKTLSDKIAQIGLTDTEQFLYSLNSEIRDMAEQFKEAGGDDSDIANLAAYRQKAISYELQTIMDEAQNTINSLSTNALVYQLESLDKAQREAIQGAKLLGASESALAILRESYAAQAREILADAANAYISAYDDTLSEISDLESQQQELEDNLADARDEYMDSLKDEIDLKKESTEALEDTIDSLETYIGNLSDLKVQLLQDAEFMSPEEQAGYSMARFLRIANQASTGNEDARGNISEAATSALEDAKQYGSYAAYLASFAQIYGTVDSLMTGAEDELSDAQKQLDALTAQNESLQAIYDQLQADASDELDRWGAEKAYYEAMAALNKSTYPYQIAMLQGQIDMHEDIVEGLRDQYDTSLTLADAADQYNEVLQTLEEYFGDTTATDEMYKLRQEAETQTDQNESIIAILEEIRDGGGGESNIDSDAISDAIVSSLVSVFDMSEVPDNSVIGLLKGIKDCSCNAFGASCGTFASGCWGPEQLFSEYGESITQREADIMWDMVAEIGVTSSYDVGTDSLITTTYDTTKVPFASAKNAIQFIDSIPAVYVFSSGSGASQFGAFIDTATDTKGTCGEYEIMFDTDVILWPVNPDEEP